MASDIEKYRAQVFQVLGLASLTPFGRAFLNLPNFDIHKLTFNSLFSAAIILLTFYLGVIFILKGEEHLS